MELAPYMLLATSQGVPSRMMRWSLPHMFVEGLLEEKLLVEGWREGENVFVDDWGLENAFAKGEGEEEGVAEVEKEEEGEGDAIGKGEKEAMAEEEGVIEEDDEADIDGMSSGVISGVTVTFVLGWS